MFLKVSGAMAALLAAIWFPFFGPMVAMVILTASGIPVLTVHERIAPLSARIGDHIGKDGMLVTAALVGGVMFALGVFAFISACFDRRRAGEYASVGVFFFGLLAAAASSYFRFKFNY